VREKWVMEGVREEWIMEEGGREEERRNECSISDGGGDGGER